MDNNAVTDDELTKLICSKSHFIQGISNLSSGWCIIIATITASMAGALLFPKGVNNNE